MNKDELYEVCYECTGYGCDYRYDEELQELVSNCEDCWATEALRGEQE